MEQNTGYKMFLTKGVFVSYGCNYHPKGNMFEVLKSTLFVIRKLDDQLPIRSGQG